MSAAQQALRAERAAKLELNELTRKVSDAGAKIELLETKNRRLDEKVSALEGELKQAQDEIDRVRIVGDSKYDALMAQYESFRDEFAAEMTGLRALLEQNKSGQTVNEDNDDAEDTVEKMALWLKDDLARAGMTKLPAFKTLVNNIFQHFLQIRKLTPENLPDYPQPEPRRSLVDGQLEDWSNIDPALHPPELEPSAAADTDAPKRFDWSMSASSSVNAKLLKEMIEYATKHAQLLHAPAALLVAKLTTEDLRDAFEDKYTKLANAYRKHQKTVTFRRVEKAGLMPMARCESDDDDDGEEDNDEQQQLTPLEKVHARQGESIVMKQSKKGTRAMKEQRKLSKANRRLKGYNALPHDSPWRAEKYQDGLKAQHQSEDEDHPDEAKRNAGTWLTLSYAWESTELRGLKDACDASYHNLPATGRGGTKPNERERSTVRSQRDLPTIVDPTNRIRRWEIEDEYFASVLDKKPNLKRLWVASGIAWGEATEDPDIVNHKPPRQTKREEGMKRKADELVDALNQTKRRKSTRTRGEGAADGETG